MAGDRINVQYLGHSGFRVEIAQKVLIFDYQDGPINLTDKNTFVFVSHSHPDHYNQVIFDWQRLHSNIQYILSDDLDCKKNLSNITVMSAYEEVIIDGLKIKSYGSTDLGVSFLVLSDGCSIFHAGDLNWWNWWEDTAENIALAETDFKREIARIKGEQVDLAFFPVDPRLEHNSDLGADYFIHEIKPRYVIPMHFWANEQVIKAFAAKQRNIATEVVCLVKPGAELLIDM